jgi:hypothetical protein
MLEIICIISIGLWIGTTLFLINGLYLKKENRNKKNETIVLEPVIYSKADFIEIPDGICGRRAWDLHFYIDNHDCGDPYDWKGIADYVDNCTIEIRTPIFLSSDMKEALIKGARKINMHHIRWTRRRLDGAEDKYCIEVSNIHGC